MPNATELMLSDLQEKYAAQAASPAFKRLYEDEHEFGHMFAVLHGRLNGHFAGINDRARTTSHYWADPSRDFLDLIEDITQDFHDLERAGVSVGLVDAYQRAIERCEPWLSRSGGSTVPNGFEPIELVKVEPAITRPATTVKLAEQPKQAALKMIGEGSYAQVYSYVDPNYGIKFAVKRAKRGIDERDQLRFRQEFDVMNNLSFPYVIEVYKYDVERNEYRMEFCDETLRTYIARTNGSLAFASRKRIALQFLYGINYIHTQGHLHRDISLQNVLVKLFDSGAVIVKLSDFGLAKKQNSEFTRTQTEMRGTIRDPQLHSFKDYGAQNEIYSIGWVLSYIFTGRDALTSDSSEVGRIVRKCTAHDMADRYATVLELIGDVEKLDATPVDASA